MKQAPIHTKPITSKLQDLSEKDGAKQVKVVFSRMNVRDSDNDVILTGAYTKTISELGPKNANLIYHLKDHNWSVDSIVGNLQELYVDGDDLIGVTYFDDKDPIHMMNHGKYLRGEIKQHSVGIITIRSQRNKDGNYNELQEVKMLEGSAVLWGANRFTPTLSVKSEYQQNPESLLHDIEQEYNTLKEMLKKHIPAEDFFFESMAFEDKLNQLRLIKESTPPQQRTEPPTVKEQVDSFFFGNKK